MSLPLVPGASAARPDPTPTAMPDVLEATRPTDRSGLAEATNPGATLGRLRQVMEAVLELQAVSLDVLGQRAAVRDAEHGVLLTTAVAASALYDDLDLPEGHYTMSVKRTHIARRLFGSPRPVQRQVTDDRVARLIAARLTENAFSTGSAQEGRGPRLYDGVALSPDGVSPDGELVHVRTSWNRGEDSAEFRAIYAGARVHTELRARTPAIVHLRPSGGDGRYVESVERAGALVRTGTPYTAASVEASGIEPWQALAGLRDALRRRTDALSAMHAETHRRLAVLRQG